jgi:hypothetical protein
MQVDVLVLNHKDRLSQSRDCRNGSDRIDNGLLRKVIWKAVSSK